MLIVVIIVLHFLKSLKKLICMTFKLKGGRLKREPPENRLEKKKKKSHYFSQQ